MQMHVKSSPWKCLEGKMYVLGEALTETTCLGTHRLPWWISGKESTCQCRRLRRRGFNPWVGNIPSAWQCNFPLQGRQGSRGCIPHPAISSPVVPFSSCPQSLPASESFPVCHPAISSSVVPFSSCPQSLPASESFSMSQLFASGGQRIGASASMPVWNSWKRL